MDWSYFIYIKPVNQSMATAMEDTHKKSKVEDKQDVLETTSELSHVAENSR